MAEPPTNRFALRRWWVPLLLVFAAVCAYVGDLHTRILLSERLWLIVTVVAAVMIVLGWLAQFLLPFVDLFGGRRKPPRDS